MLITDLPFRTSGPFAETTPAGTDYHRLYINETGDEMVLVTVPNTALERDDVTLVIACHGFGGSYNSFNEHPPFLEFRHMCTDNGWIVASPNMHGNQWGNQIALDDLARVHAYFTALWPTVRVLLMGGSMGGLTVLNAASRNAVPDVRGVVTVAGVVDLAVTHGMSAYRDSIRTAYGIASDGSDFTAKTTGYNPIRRPGLAWSADNIDMYHSPDDTAITLAAHPLAWEATRRNEWARWQRLTVTSGEHITAGNFNIPKMRQFMRATASDTLAPAAQRAVPTSLKAFDGFEWVPVPAKAQALDGSWVETPVTAYA